MMRAELELADSPARLPGLISITMVEWVDPGGGPDFLLYNSRTINAVANRSQTNPIPNRMSQSVKRPPQVIGDSPTAQKASQMNGARSEAPATAKAIPVSKVIPHSFQVAGFSHVITAPAAEPERGSVGQKHAAIRLLGMNFRNGNRGTVEPRPVRAAGISA
jgi:hypothetical protein